MPDIAVLTGDLNNSSGSAVSNGPRRRLDQVLRRMEDRYPTETVTARETDFQVVLNQPELVLEGALFIRAGVIAGSPSRNDRWDARISMALGVVGKDTYKESERGLQTLERRHLRLYSRPEALTMALDLATAFVDDIVDYWTPSEAEAYFEYLQEPGGHKAIAERLRKSRPTVTKTLLRAKYNLLDRYRRDTVALMHDGQLNGIAG